MQKNENGIKAIFAVLLMCFAGSAAYAVRIPAHGEQGFQGNVNVDSSCT